MNVAVLRGSLSRDPELRVLPSGTQIVTCEVTVRDTVPAESVPVAWADPPASSDRLAAGDEVVVLGRVRRRFFRAGGATASRTEVVAERVVPARQARRARSLVERAAASLVAVTG